ncbi:MAG: 6-carboxytetrahydropterin synthase QueD [Kordiimonas sp.]|nr:6-carboxytetrahydropterin synthase QueD [Kordiimonas sp.]|tara:strand:+ start:92 stop:484 length:393 start_codon:yes stop_codon:yes gene_type:complete
MEIYKIFNFDAAHHLACNVPDGHPYSRLHGHSFQAEVFLRGEPDIDTGWIVDFAQIDTALQQLRNELDHNYLNEIPGLELPTVENIACWIWNRLSPDFPQLCRIIIRRGSFGEGCIYEGPAKEPAARHHG